MAFSGWLIKTNAVFLLLVLFGLLALYTNPALLGVVLLVCALKYDALHETYDTHLAPPYLSKYARDERRLIDGRYRNSARLGLLVFGALVVIMHMLYARTGQSVRFSPRLVGIWLLVGLVYNTVGEVHRRSLALRSASYEEYRLRSAEGGRVVFLVMYVIAVLASVTWAVG